MGEVLISARELAQPIVKLYTLGYQGTDVATYVATLKAAGVGVVVDVRETAWSYKRGFCKTALSDELSKAGIEYVHLRSAGNPKVNRRTAETNKQCLQRYRRYLKQNPGGLLDLRGLGGPRRSHRRCRQFQCTFCSTRDMSSPK